MIHQLVSIYRPVPESSGVVLSSPVRGEWGVVQGGASSIINHHYSMEEQRDALDLVLLVDGREHLAGRDKLEDFPSWGALLYAPVDGTVVAAVQDRADQPIGQSDPKHPEGNNNAVKASASAYRGRVLQIQTSYST